MNVIMRLLMCCATLLIMMSCTVLHNKALKIASTNQCKSLCFERFDSCKKSCRDSCPNCSLSAYQRAAMNYTKYVHEQKVEGQIIARELNSYRDPLQCRKTTCNCLADYEECKQSFEGIIHKRLQVGPACC